MRVSDSALAGDGVSAYALEAMKTALSGARHTASNSVRACALVGARLCSVDVLRYSVRIANSSMSLLGFGRGGSRHFRLRDEVNDLETERIPAPYQRILGDRRIGVLECCNPVREALRGAARLSLCLDVSHLGEIGDPVAAPKETHRLDLRARGAAVLVHIQRGGGIVFVPQGRPGLVALCRVERPALLVVTLRRDEIEALTDRDVVSHEIARHRLIHAGLAGIDGNYIDNAASVIDANHERLDSLQRHQQQERSPTCNSAHPTGSSDAPRHASAAMRRSYAVVIPGGGLPKVGVERLSGRRGLHGFPDASTGGDAFDFDGDGCAVEAAVRSGML